MKKLVLAMIDWLWCWPICCALVIGICSADSAADARAKLADAVANAAAAADKSAKQQEKTLADENATHAKYSAEVAEALAKATSTAQYQLWALLFTTFGGFAGILFKYIVEERRENKQRRWAKEDAEFKDRQLKQIHTLVNSAMTEALMRELAAKKELLVYMGKLQGSDLSVEVKAQVAATELSVKLLEAQLAERERQTVIADLEAKHLLSQGISGQ